MDALEDIQVIDVDAEDAIDVAVNVDGVIEVIDNDNGRVFSSTKHGRKAGPVDVFDIPFSFEDKILIGSMCLFNTHLL